MAGCTLALGAIGWLSRPTWMGDFLEASAAKVRGVFGASPTVWGMATSVCGGESACSLPLAATMVLLLLAAGVAYALRSASPSPSWALAWFTPIALLITPYTLSYDQTLLIAPLTLVMARMIDRGLPYLAIAGIPPLLSGLALACLALAAAISLDLWSGLVPLAVLLLVAWQSRGPDPVQHPPVPAVAPLNSR